MSEPAWVPIGGALQDVGAEVAYQEFTAPVSITATTEAAAQTVVTAPAFNADGSSQYLVEFFAPMGIPNAVAADKVIFYLYLDGVSLGWWSQVLTPAAAQMQVPVRLARRLTPAAGARTFSVRASTGAGTSTVYAGPGGIGTWFPGFIRVTKIPSAAPGMYGLVPPTAIGTVLPASPVDGQEFILTDSLTAPTYQWHLRYVAAKSANKWVYLGGAAATVIVDTDETTTTTGSALDLTTVGPTFTIPVAGTYLIEARAEFYHTVATAHGVIGVSLGAGAFLFSSGASQVIGSTSVGMGFWRTMTRNAGDAMRVRYMLVTAGTGHWIYRMLSVTPVAVGG